MALQKQIIPFSFSTGIDTKTDPKQLSGKLALLENGIFSSPKQIKKRNGFQALAQTTFSGSTISQGVGTATFKNELLSFDGSQLYSFSQAAGQWSPKGSLVSMAITSQPITRNSNRQLVQDSATHPSGMQCFTWEDSTGTLRYSLSDSNTNEQIVTNALITGAGARPKPVVLGNYFVIFFFNVATGRLQYASISIGSPTVLNAPLDFNTNMNTTNFIYDVCVYQNSAFVAYNNSAGGISARTLNAYLQVGTVFTIGSDPASNSINIFADLPGNIWIAYCNGTATKVVVANQALSTIVLAVKTLETVVSRNITGQVQGTTATIFYEVAGSTEYYNSIRKNTCTLTGTLGTAAQMVRSVGLVSKAFVYNSQQYVIAAYGPGPASLNTPTLQPSYFILNSSGQVVGKIANQVAGGTTIDSILTEVTQVSSGIFQFAFLQKDFISTISGNVFSNTGVMSGQLNFVNAKFQTVELGSNLHITGGILSCYDGQSVSEHGFNVFPEGLSTTVSSTGGSLSAGSYQYVAVYRWTDAQGQDHNSAPSVGLTVTTTGTTSSVTVKVPMLRLTGKPSVRIMLYRTVVNQTTLYAVTTVANPVLNDPTQDFVNITDGLADATIIGNEQIYTTGGVIENIAAPATQVIGTYKNRLILIPSENPLTWWFSQQTIPGTPVQTNDTFITNIDQRGGGITAVSQIDANLIFFKSNNMFYITGDGPASNGTSDDFSDALLIAADSGCVNTKSLVAVPAGLMYQSNKGIYLLNRSLVDQYIGADVEGFNSAAVTSAQLCATVNQVRFTLSTGIALVYDTQVGQWSTFTNIAALDSCFWQNKFCYIQSTGTVQQETPGFFTDNGSFIRLRVRTSWLSFAGIQGFQRVYKMMILGDYKSPHTLMVRCAYDFIPAASQEELINATSLVNPNGTYASGPGLYASGSGSYGGPDPTYQFRVDLANQKTEAIQITIEDAQSSAFGEGFSLSSLAFEVGLKAGINRLPATRIFG